MKNELLEGSKSPVGLFRSARYKSEFRAAHPEYFDPEGLMVFCGPQGSGKTLSAVQYCRKIIDRYPGCKFVTNVEISGLPDTLEVIEYDGLDSLFNISNGYAGVLYLIDEIHLEFNSLESKNMSIEEMTEFAQQRKQRKHIVGTSQDITLQHNQLIDGTTAIEENGKLQCDVLGNYWWVHSPELYGCYDTYAKMKRYKKEWRGRTRAPTALPYDTPAVVERPQLGRGR